MSDQYNGDWFGKFGECKLCGGDIPHGHSDNCHIWKTDEEARSLRTQITQLTAERDEAVSECEALKATNERINGFADEWCKRGNLAEQQNGELRAKILAVNRLVKHAWIHSAYKDCGRDQMTTEEKELYDQICNTPSEDLEALSTHKQGGEKSG